MDESPEIAELIEAYLDQMRSGTAPPPEAFAAAHPECAGELLRLLPLLSALEREAAGNEPDATVKIAPGDRVRGLPDLRDADFQLIREISHGGMGTVFEAVQLSLGRKVAVKILSPTLLTDAGQRASFENEARTIAIPVFFVRTLCKSRM